MLKNLLYELKDGIAVVTVNRPAVRNALNRKTISELKNVIERLGNDDSVRVAILTGAGDKAFVAGADINEISTLALESGKEFALSGQSAFDLIEHVGKPVIAAVNGFALGGGCELAMACTFRIASENAVFGQPEVKLGIIPGYGGSQRLQRFVGKGPALELLLTGDLISAAEALRLGLVNRVVPAAELMPAADAIAKKIRDNGPLAVKFCLEAVQRGAEMSLGDGQNLEAELFGRCCATSDMKEGTRAFLEKRKAEFTGK
jgi:enoyl-CoA hydratase